MTTHNELSELGISSLNETQGCGDVGEGLPDIAGIGVLVSFGGQALLSLVLAAWVYSQRGKLEIWHEEGTVEHTRAIRRLHHFSDLLMVGNDIQVLLGIAYMVTVWTKSEIDLYHLRLAFDTVSIVGVSSTTALVCWTLCNDKLNQRPSRRSFRYLAIYIYEILFAILTIHLLLHLSNWNEFAEEPGFCYNSRFVSFPSASHPLSDQFYVVIMAIYLHGSMLTATLAGPGLHRTMLILVLAVLQYTIHMYFMIAVRSVNQEFLIQVENENGWDFGQTTAMLLLGFAYFEVVHKIQGYKRFARESDKEIYARQMERELLAIAYAERDEMYEKKMAARHMERV